jgi:integrase
MKGHIRQRGPQSWQLCLDLGRDAEGKRRREQHPFHGSKRAAQAKLAELVSAIGKNAHVERSGLTIGAHVLERVEQWAKLNRISPKTSERYLELAANQISPHLGAIALQELKAADIERWHATLLASGRKDGTGGLSALTVRHAHRLLGKALKEAQRFDLIVRNPTIGERPPKVVRQEVVILSGDEARAVVTKLRDHPIYPRAILGLCGGLRRSEILALRWGAVDLDRQVLRVVEALEETVAGGLRFKEPKSAAGKREVTLPDIVVAALRDHWRRQAEQRMKLQAGRPTADALVFSRLDGGPLSPNAMSKEWTKSAASIGIAATFHALRHTHVSHLIEAAVNVVKISRRVGHADVATTLNVYAHLFDAREDKSAEAINAAVAALLGP